MASINRPTRRTFLQSAGAVAAATWATGPTILRAQTGDKLRIAMIGVGGRGRANLKGVAGEHIAAICDVDRTALEQVAALYPQARKEVDFRRIFDHPGEFDAVLVSTTEHTHAFATLPALQLKKHVYCEKPLAYNVQQTRLIREAASKAGVATQMGTQVHASDNYRRVVELVQSGAIGKISECHVWVARAWGWHATEAEATDVQGHRVRAEPPGDRGPRACRRRVGPLARPRARAAIQQRLSARAQVVSLVGLRQWNHERPGQSLD